jgi:hypothetical protein
MRPIEGRVLMTAMIVRARESAPRHGNKTTAQTL